MINKSVNLKKGYRLYSVMFGLQFTYLKAVDVLSLLIAFNSTNCSCFGHTVLKSFLKTKTNRNPNDYKII